MTQTPAILWFRNDLRLADHTALHAALEGGRPVLPVYILDDKAAGAWTPGGAARWWLHHSLAALDTALRARGSRLVLRRGKSADELADLAQQTGATDIFTGGSAEPWARQLDRAVAEQLQLFGVQVHRMRTMMLFHPDQVHTKSGGAFSVYTPFANACLALGGPRPALPAPAALPGPPPVASDRLEDWQLLPDSPDWAGGLRATWTPGEAGAQARLTAFLQGGLSGYASRRDNPAEDVTSMLSPHLRFGELSAASVWHAVRSLSPDANTEKFIRELLWREFSVHLLWQHPDLPEQPLRREFSAMPWREDPDALRAWQRGQTGIPIVDAGMRQLWQTGWMHNRVRMIVASVLVKHLLIPWQLGEAWFWDTLVDADLANNAANWQWVAGSGADAAPYFRIFNPVLQGRKFDAEGTYVRRFVPELARLDARLIHAPWEAPETALASAGIRLGATYPHPIVDLAGGRARALAAYATVKSAA
ncbi:MAG: deoxyribodipyrimidine photo-lyase [Proteobacteria bacterium]|nr:deoxyribodipyrimidine photo-lyase [Pseudomonadota bacterium]